MISPTAPIYAYHGYIPPLLEVGGTLRPMITWQVPTPDPTDKGLRHCLPRRVLHHQWWTPSYIADWFLLVVIGAAMIPEYLLWNPHIRPYQTASLVNVSSSPSPSPSPHPVINSTALQSRASLPRAQTGSGDPTFTFNDNQYQFPPKPETFDMVATPLLCFMMPILIFIAYYLLRLLPPWRINDVHDLHHSILGMCTALEIAYFTWIPISKSTGQFRPDFWYDVTQGTAEDVKQGRQSFPSGHVVMAFFGLGYLALWLSGKLQVFHPTRGQLWRFALAVGAPMSLAFAIACTRVGDNRHGPVDITAGALIGAWAAIAAYLLFYPPPYAPDCQRPKNRKLGFPNVLLSGVPVQPVPIPPPLPIYASPLPSPAL